MFNFCAATKHASDWRKPFAVDLLMPDSIVTTSCDYSKVDPVQLTNQRAACGDKTTILYCSTCTLWWILTQIEKLATNIYGQRQISNLQGLISMVTQTSDAKISIDFLQNKSQSVFPRPIWQSETTMKNNVCIKVICQSRHTHYHFNTTSDKIYVANKTRNFKYSLNWLQHSSMRNGGLVSFQIRTWALPFWTSHMIDCLELDDAIRRRWPWRGCDSLCPDAAWSTISAHSQFSDLNMLTSTDADCSVVAQEIEGAPWHQHSGHATTDHVIPDSLNLHHLPDLGRIHVIITLIS
jgi:hypothetical protein